MQYRTDKYGNKLSVLGYGCMRFTKTAGVIDLDKAEKELEKETKGLDVKVKLHLSGTPYRILLDTIILTLDTDTHNTLYFILSGNFL